MSSPAPGSADILRQLENVLASPSFRGAERSSRILRFLVEQTVAGNADSLKEYTIGAEALGRGASFDPRIDAIARVEVSRLRTRLEQYYATAGRHDEIVLVLPRGSYVPGIERRKPEPVNATDPPDRDWRWAGWAAAAVLLLGILGFLHSRIPHPPTKQPSISLDVELWPDGQFANVVGTQLALSPDGSAIVFTARAPAGGSELYLRRLDGSDNVRLPGTEGARGPFFSPDSEWVAFWATGKLKKAPLRGGAPITLCDAPDLLGGTWADDGNIIAALTTEAKLWRIPASGGQPSAILDATPQVQRLMWPHVLPGSRAVLFSSVGLTPDSGTIDVLSLADGSRRTLVRNGVFGRYISSGHIVYVNQGSLYAQRFDADRLELQGSAALIVPDVEFSPTFGFAHFDVSNNGTLAYRRRSASGQFTLGMISPEGESSPIVPGAGPWLWPRVSPDGKRVAVTRAESGESRIWIVDVESGNTVPFSAAKGHAAAAVWLPDGKSLAFQGRGTLEWLPVGSSGTARTLMTGGVYIPWSISRDGTRMAYYQLNASTHFDLWTVPLSWEGSELRVGTPEPFLRTTAVETYPSFSPDGQWIAYVSLQSGAYEVYVRSFGREGSEVQVSKGGGRLPVWLRQRPELIYETEDHRLMVAPWRVRDGVFEAEKPRAWGELRLGDTGVLPNFDVASDGRIVALMPVEGPRRGRSQLRNQLRNHVTFRLNFFDEVERRLAPR